MKTNTEIAIECGAKPTVYTNDGCFAVAKALTFTELQLQPFVEKVNARDSEPVGEIVEVEYTTSGKDVFLRSTFKNMPIGTKLFTAPQPNQSEYIKRLEDALNEINLLRSSTMNFGVARAIACKALGIPHTDSKERPSFTNVHAKLAKG